jgi:hypothetical protein
VQKVAELAVRKGSQLYTDSASSYRALKGYTHDFVNHTKKEYARGEVHENRAELILQAALEPASDCQQGEKGRIYQVLRPLCVSTKPDKLSEDPRIQEER